VGWLDRKQRRRVRKKYHVRTQYFCDMGDHPIPVGELLVIDPKKGYFPWSSSVPQAVRGLTARQPKWCACYTCHKKERDRIREEKEKKRMLRYAVRRVIEVIDHKPRRGYWTKDKCVSKLSGEFPGEVVLQAIRKLRKRGSLKTRDGAYLLA